MVKIVSDYSEIPSTGLVLIDFFATWCGPCKAIAPKFEELSKVYTNVTFLKVDVDEDESRHLVDEYDVQAMPTFVFLRDRTFVKKIEGADLKAIGAMLEQTW